MSRAVRFTDHKGRTVYVAAEHVNCVMQGSPEDGGGTAIEVGGRSIIMVAEPAEAVAALIWPERWQSIVDDGDAAPDGVGAPDGWVPIGPWCCGGFSMTPQSMGYQRGYGVLWTRPLRRVAVTP